MQLAAQVTDVNKADYIRLVCQEKMTGAIRKQLAAFLEGFYDIIPRRLIAIFNEQELELLLSGEQIGFAKLADNNLSQPPRPPGYQH
jgi:hypothetical protein